MSASSFVVSGTININEINKWLSYRQILFSFFYMIYSINYHDYNHSCVIVYSTLIFTEQVIPNSFIDKTLFSWKVPYKVPIPIKSKIEGKLYENT